ncbi:MAG: 3-methyl-2-oxobutanoate hydroxymethyltransferase, partial [Rhodobacteraceae bacterium]|nr:3-methyl-2-oxobutanoate hydroxymethyltransferase [Paracoccaceae bacterium]
MSKAPNNAAAKIKVPDIRARKGGTPIVAIVGYTAPIAKIVNDIVDFILVGDSVGMTVYGASTTVGV